MNPLRTRRKVSIDSFSPSLTEQSHKNSCDMNHILKKYKKTGVLPHVNHMVGKYTDYPNSIDFHQMQLIIANAKSMFESIPSHIRAKFANDPGKFIDFAQDPANHDAMLEMGFSANHLPEKPVEPPPADPPVEPVPEPAPDPGA